MRIDPVQVAAMVSPADRTDNRDHPTVPQQEHSRIESSLSSPVATPDAKQVSVSMDQDKNIIYEFLEARTGIVVQQVPPEEVLKVMRSIGEYLKQAEQKVDSVA